MFPSQLPLTSDQFPAGPAFDLSDANFEWTRLPSTIFVGSVERVLREGLPKTGSFVIDYPFGKPCVRLGEYSVPQASESPDSRQGQESTDIPLERAVRSAIDSMVAGISASAAEAGCCKHNVFLLINELLKNATQYGSIGEHVGRAGLLKLEWSISEDPNDPRIGITVSNPISRLFDPSRYCRMTEDEYLQAFLDGCGKDGSFNGHGGAMALAGLSKSGSPLTYLWNVEDGGYVMLTIKHNKATEQEVSDSDNSGASNFTVEAKRFDRDRRLVNGYDLGVFDADVQNGLRVHSVTVACVMGKAHIS